MNLLHRLHLTLAAAALAAGPAHAETSRNDATSSPPTSAAPTAAPAASLVDAEVRRVDVATRRITLRHGPIPNLAMSAMTMVFQVRDPKMLDGLSPGDTVRFTADRVDGVYLVTSIEAVR